jgi:hypothetical protein
MNEKSEALPEGQIREHDTFFGEKVSAQQDKRKPNVWLNCLWMAGPLFFTITSTFLTGLPLAMFLVIPGAIGGLINWIISSSPGRKQVWRSVFIGCLASWVFLGVLASQWP